MSNAMWIFKFLWLSKLLIEIFTCNEDKFEITTQLKRPYWKYDPRRGNVWITQETTIQNSTVICQNVHSVQHIVYAYREQNYDQNLKIINSNISIIHPMEFTRFPTIIKLFLINLQISRILPGAFNGLTRIKELYLNDNILTEISNGVFNSLHRLETLNLNNNQIHKMDAYCLMGTAELQTLHLNHNNISVVENGVFESLSHLKYIDVSENPLEKFPFEDLSNIELVIVTKAELTSIEEDLSNLTMKVLNISYNHILQVDFSYLPRVNFLDISHNDIKTVENCQSLDAVDVKLDNNKIVNFDGLFEHTAHLSVTRNQLEILEVMFNDSEMITRLDFSYNRISKIEKTFFQNMTNLKSLYLQNNNISKIDPMLFRDLKNVVILDLSHNKIKEFQYGSFDNLLKLEMFNISNNNLLNLHQYTFSSLASLRSLYFDNNQISSFDVTVLKIHLPNLRNISLNHNTWSCKELVKIEQLCKRLKINILPGYSYNVENFRGIECSNGNEFTASDNISMVSVQEVAQNIQKGINSGLQNSKMERFFNEEFGKSKLVEYFDKDYMQSNFFKFLNNYKFTMVTQQLNDTKMEKFTGLQITPSESNNKILIFGVVLLSIVVFLLLSAFCLAFSYLYKFRSHNLSQMELC